MQDTLLHKYLIGEASETEVQTVFEWMEASPENRQELVRLKQIWAITASAEVDDESGWNKVISRTKMKKEHKKGWRSFLKYAAIAFVLISFGALLQFLLPSKQTPEIFAANTTFKVPVGQVSSLMLPDGTEVYLNSQSELSYSNNFSMGKRVVALSGEAYFNVRSDEEHPFIVKTPGEVSVKVYGTAFNLRAYSDEGKIHTVLEEGSVSIIDNNGNELTQLVPGEKASCSFSSKHLRINKVRTELFSSWKDGLITFRNERLEDIARMMQRWYNVKIVIEDKKLADELYNGTIMKNKPLDQILEVFRITSEIEYEVVPQSDKPTIIYWRKAKT